EVFRSNMTAGAISYTTLASVAVANAEEFTYFPTSAPISNLSPANVVAVEVHQQAANSSDLGFDLELTGIGYVLPAPPELSIDLLPDGQIQISWGAFTPGWNLFVSDQLGSAAAWAQVTTAPVIRGNKKVL